MTTPPPRSPSRGISEIVFVVDDVLEAARFYREVVGLIPESEPSREWAWFWAGPPGENQRIALRHGTLLFEEHSPLPPEQRWGRIHYAFEVPRSDLEEAVQRVRSHETPVYGPMQIGWMKAIAYYFYDPAGNLLEFWSPEPS